MAQGLECIVGTSGYSFADWVGPFYPPATRGQDMFKHYVRHFPAVEVNYTYYRMPTARTMDSLNRLSPKGFRFWVKALGEITHHQKTAPAGQFLDALAPLSENGKLAGVLLQFPQSFHRTVGNRRYLAAAIDALTGPPLAVEFRHRSWQDDATLAGLRERNVTLVVPDVPAELTDLYHTGPVATTDTGYLRLHSRNAAKWYAGEAERYDYFYSPAELTQLLQNWTPPGPDVRRLYAFFNNCRNGQAARNAQTFQRLADDLLGGAADQPGG